MLTVTDGDRYGSAAGMAGLPGRCVKEQWPAGDRFAMMIGSAKLTDSFNSATMPATSQQRWGSRVVEAAQLHCKKFSQSARSR
jgi:hypothetical protein